MHRFYRIAGLNVQMDTFGRALEQAAPYEISEPASVDLVMEQVWEQFQDQYPGMDSDGIEYMYSGAVFYHHLLDYSGMMLHSSAVVVDGKAYLFSADSGTGKSTHTELWLKLFRERAYILNDDKPAIRREEEGWFAYGTPWSGKHDISVNARVPVAGIAMIERAEKNEISPFSGKEAIRQVMAQLNPVKSMTYRIKQMELLDKLFREVPIWHLRCNMEKEAAIVSYEAMSGEKFKENEV